MSPFLYYIRVPAKYRDALREYMAERGVDTGIHWQPGHGFSLFENCRAGTLDVTETVAAEILSLPLHSLMEIKTQQMVVSAVREFFAG
jgi:dTDP-4-amino-4,6-dideoxygalactose transaminase